MNTLKKYWEDVERSSQGDTEPLRRAVEDLERATERSLNALVDQPTDRQGERRSLVSRFIGAIGARLRPCTMRSR